MRLGGRVVARSKEQAGLLVLRSHRTHEARRADFRGRQVARRSSDVLSIYAGTIRWLRDGRCGCWMGAGWVKLRVVFCGASRVVDEAQSPNSTRPSKVALARATRG